MAIPEFQAFMLPLLTLAQDGQEHSLAGARESLAQQFSLTPEERNELLPSGRQRRFDNRVAWAKVYLEQADLLTSPRRAHFVITTRGRDLLAEQPQRIDIPLLERYDEFRQFRYATRKTDGESHVVSVPTETQSATPEELLEQSYQSIRAELVSEVLSRVKSSSPDFFEKLVVELLLKMGYGRTAPKRAAPLEAPGTKALTE